MSDVLIRQDQYFIFFGPDWTFSHPKIRFELKCSKAQATKIIETQVDSFLREFAVVAKINDILKPVFSVKSYPEEEDYSRIDLESSDIFIARGKCLDFLYLEGQSSRKLSGS